MMLHFPRDASRNRSEGAAAFVDKLRACLSAETLLRSNESLAKRTTLRVGGPADVYAEPASADDLSALLRACNEAAMPLFVLGRGSNLIVRDGGFRGVVVSLAHAAFNSIEEINGRIRAGAGARLKHVAVEARNHELSGFEFLEGIPGSVGGALRMNAGAMGSSFFELVKEVELMDRFGKVSIRAANELGAVYRSCDFFEDHIALAASLEGGRSSRAGIEEKMREFSRKRWSSQPAAPSAGCMFKNPKEAPAGKLIDELGLKGLRVGGAFVSQEHGNFLVTDGKASARDVLELISLVREKVRRARGVELESEVVAIGEEEPAQIADTHKHEARAE